MPLKWVGFCKKSLKMGPISLKIPNCICGSDVFFFVANRKRWIPFNGIFPYMGIPGFGGKIPLNMGMGRGLGAVLGTCPTNPNLSPPPRTFKTARNTYVIIKWLWQL